MKRSRGRNRRSGGNNQNAFNNPNRHYESVGPDVKIRGSAQQILEKYLQYGRDAQTSGDRILSEAYFQFAEHYQRIVAKQQEARMQQQQQQGFQRVPREDRDFPPRGERDVRGPVNEPSDAAAIDDLAAEVEVTPVNVGRGLAGEVDDAGDVLRVIGAEDEDEAEASDDPPQGAVATNGHDPRAPQESRDRGLRERGRRRPYRPREAREFDGIGDETTPPETDGIMKTLSRGRRRAAPEESAAADTD